jgi:copper transport protein
MMKSLRFKAGTINPVPASRLLVIFLLTLLLGSISPALAHGYLVRSIPEDRAAMERAPARLQYWFSESLEPDFSSLTVRDADGNIVATGGLAPDNPSLLTVRLPRDLPDGTYVVDMRLAFASDGHVVAQSRIFFIGQAVEGVAGSGATTQADPLEIVWRAISLSSALLMFGVFTLYAGVLLPAWGNPNYREGWLPPRVMRRLSWVIAAALVAALAGNLLALAQQSMAFFGADLGQVISGGLWSDVRAGTRFGDLWTARMLLLALVGGAYGLSLFFREEQPETVRPFWTASAWAMALVLGTFSAGSHAAGSPLWAWVAVGVDWLHTLAVGFWAGGLAALVLVLPTALAPYADDARRLALLAVLRRFSRLAVICVVLVITTGIYSAFNWIHTPGDVSENSYGGALAIKLLLVAGLLLLGLAHHIALHPERYTRWTGVIRRVGHFLPTLRLEAIFALLIVLSVGWLSASPIPVPDSVQEAVPPPSATTTVDGLTVTMTISPGGAGINTYDVLVTQDGQPLDGLDVRAQLISPSRDRRSPLLHAEDVESGLYVAAGAEIDQPGEWWALVDITTPEGTKHRAAFDWNITNDAAVEQTRQPTLMNLLSLAGVLAAISYAVYPSARRLYERLDLSPAAVTVAVGSAVATVFFVLLGLVLVAHTQAQYDATLNPPPQVVNSVLPDTESLARGADLYAAHCSGWANQADLEALIERLPRARDDELFAAVRDGWRGLPPCEPLSDVERWDTVNYLRTLS